MQPRVRFAPSPTGQVHIGNIRTAIFNWLFARHNNGSFLLRIEDTDRERSTQAAIDTLLDCMEWLGLDHDGETVYQTQMFSSHAEAAAKMEADGTAYRPVTADGGPAPLIFRIPFDCDKLGFVRPAGDAVLETHPGAEVKVSLNGVTWSQTSRKGTPAENSACLAGFAGLRLHNKNNACVFELEKNMSELAAGKTFSFTDCVKMTFSRREVFFKDIVKGELAKPLDSMKDFVIVRSDGNPVFHLANVRDDIFQGITHIVRGDDHVENTYRHLFLFKALGAEPPQYGHMPMIVNAAGKPYSKRDGDAFVGDFKSKGLPAEALFNYLALLGWSPGDDREKMTRKEMIEAFTLERVKSSSAQFDMAKLLNLSGQYIAETPFDKFVETARAALPSGEAWTKGVDEAKFRAVAAQMQVRTKMFSSVAEWKYFFSDNMERDQKAVDKFLKDEKARKALADFAEAAEKMPSFDEKNVEAEIRRAEEANGVPQGKLNQPMRIAVTGTTTGAGIYETLALLGKESAASRIKEALAKA